MICPNCGLEMGERGRFCPWCGAPQAVLTGPDAPEIGVEDSGAVSSRASDHAPEDQELRELRSDFDAMAAEMGRLSLRLYDLERRRGVSGSSQPATPPMTSARPLPSSPSAAERLSETRVTPATPSLRESIPAPTPADAVAPVVTRPVGEADTALERTRRGPAGYAPAEGFQSVGATGVGLPRLPSVDLASWNWEWLVGGNWLARIGIVALILGVAFFISLAIDRGWLGEMERVALGGGGGLVFLGAGEYWRRRYAVWAQTVTGGGLAILYLSVYGAFALYELISPLTAFGAFSLITLAGAVLSLRHDAVAVAVFSIFGGFATPLLLQDRLPDQRLLLAYVLVLDVGVLILASFRNWRWFTLLAWVGSLVLFGFWQQELEPPTGLAQIGITAIFLIFAGATVAFHVIRQQASGILDLVLVTVNAAAFYGISYWLIYDIHRPWMGGFTASIAAFYALLAAACRWRGEAQFNLTLFSAGLAVVFAVLAAPIQLGGPWISVAWGVEGLVLVWMSFPLRMRELRWAGYAMFVVSAVWLLALDTPDAFTRNFTPFLNEYMISYAAAVALPALAGWLLHLRRDALETGEQAAIPVFALRSAIFAAVLVPIQLDGIWIAIGWMIETMVFLWLSFHIRIREVRWFGYVMAALFVVWLLGVDSPDAFQEDLTPFINWYMLGYAAATLTLASAAWLTWRKREELQYQEERVHAVLAVGACAVAAVAVPVQLDGVWITVAWAMEAALMLWVSFLLTLREVRWFGYLVFVVLSAWLLAVDSPGAFREDLTPFLNLYMLSYGVVVVSGVLSAWLLRHKRDRLDGYERAAYPAFMVGAAAAAAIAVPMQIEWPWITMVWAAEALFLMWLSFSLRAREIRWFGYIMFAVFSAWLLGWDTPRALVQDFTFFLNWHTLNFAAGVAASALAGYLLRRRRDRLIWPEQAGYIAFALLAGVFAAVAVPVQVTGVWITVGWAVDSMILLGVSGRLNMAEMRWLGFGLLAATLVRLLVMDTLDVDLETFRPVLNWRFLAFAAGITALYSAGLLEIRRGADVASSLEAVERRMSVPALLILANLVTLWLLSAEIIASADSAFFNLSDDASENVASLGLSLLWAVYAAGLILLGVARRWRWVRLAGLALLAVPVVKLFAFDSRLLEQEYRVIAFLVLGLILVAGGLLYQRYSRVVRGFLLE